MALLIPCVRSTSSSFMFSKILIFPFASAYLYCLFEMVARACSRLVLDFILYLHSNKTCFASSTPDLHNGHIRFSLGMFSNLPVSKAKHVQPVLRRVNVVLCSTILTFPRYDWKP